MLRFSSLASFAVLATLAVLVSASPLKSAQADDCILPVCDMAGTLADFTAMRDPKRVSYVDQMVTDNKDNTDPAVSKNLIDFGTRAMAVARTGEPSPKLVDQLTLLLGQSNEQLAKYSDLSTGDLLPAFMNLTLPAARFRTIVFWGAKIADLKSLALAQTLRKFYIAAHDLCVQAKDDDFIVREAVRWQQVTEQKVIELSPVSTTVEFPLHDPAASVADFGKMGMPERFILIKALTDKYAASSDSATLIGLVNYARAVVDAIKAAGLSQDFILRQDTVLINQTVEQLARNIDLTGDDLLSWFKQLVAQTNRLAVIAYWGAHVEKSTDISFEQKMNAYFLAVNAVCVADKDDVGVSREALRLAQRANVRMIELGKAPAFQVPIADMKKAVDDFTAMTIPQRFLLIKGLVDSYVVSTDTPSLVSIVGFAKAVRDVIVAGGPDQATDLAQDDQLIARTNLQLSRSADLSADDLLVYFKTLPNAAARLAGIQYWGALVDHVADKAACTRLIKFFIGARKISFTADDDEYVQREAQKDEQLARTKLGTLGS